MFKASGSLRMGVSEINRFGEERKNDLEIKE